MGDRQRHDPGSFSWTDLSTPDAQASKDFYGGIFGWDFKDDPIPGGGVYVMARLGGRAAAAMFETTERHPAWASYITVEDVDALTARAGELGANVLAEPFDVMDVGRMSTIQDPTGAVFCLWQPRRSIGAEVVNGHGALSLNQLNSSDPEAAERFYGDLFGWRVEQVSDTETLYWGIYVGERLNGGMMQLPEGSPAPSHWLVYFGIDDIQSAAEQIGSAGGTIMIPPQEVPGGEILVAQDPQGAVFALFAGRFDD
ncbi:MAG TPA: VOC family protein [Thermoleophilaceae bacterium]|jgi:predicted enzyme related to lactoylglutathione lyase